MRNILQSVLFILFILGNSVFVKANIDSLKLELENATQLSTKLSLLQKLAYKYRPLDIEMSNQYALQIMNISKGKAFNKNRYSAYKVLGINANMSGDYHQSINYYLEALKIAKSLNNDTLIGSSYNDIAICFSDLSNTEKALYNYKKSLKAFNQANYPRGIFYVLHNLSDFYIDIEEYDLAKELMDSSLARGLRKNNKYIIPNALYSIAEIYRLQKDLKRSMEYNLRCLKYLKKSDYNLLKPSVFMSIGQIFFEKEQWDSSEYYLDKSIKVFEKHNRKGDLTEALIEMGDLKRKTEELKSAKSYLRYAIDISDDIDRVDLESRAHESLSLSLEKEKEYFWAKHHYKEFIRLKDTLFERKNKLLVINMALTYDSQLKEKEITILKKEKEVNRLQKLFIMGLTLILFVIAFWVYRGIILKRRSKEMEMSVIKQQRKALELESLHSKINPQFLYSTLNSIAMLIYENAQKAEQAIISLSEFFRYTINVRNKKHTTIKESSYIVQKYLEIEKIRFDDRLTYNIEIDDAALEYYIPRGVLQKLVENSIKCGIEKVTEGIIEVLIKKVKETIIIKVSNNGPDLFENQIIGFGLRNIYDNLNILFKDAYSLEFENDKSKSVIIKLNKLINHESDI